MSTGARFGDTSKRKEGWDAIFYVRAENEHSSEAFEAKLIEFLTMSGLDPVQSKLDFGKQVSRLDADSNVV